MSSYISPSSDQPCYVHCNFCDTVLAVRVPCSSLIETVNVRCGNCNNLLSVNILGLPLPTHATPQRALLGDSKGKMKLLLPVNRGFIGDVQGKMKALDSIQNQRRRSRDTLVLSAAVLAAACTLLLVLIYWL